MSSGGRSTGADGPEFWPPWDASSLVDLAAFASIGGVRFDERLRPQVRVADERDEPSRRAGGERFGRLLFDRMHSSVKIRYDLEPLSPRGLQFVRDPQWVLEEAGTCLDLSLMYAAMCADYHVRPYVALFEYGGTAPDHALVILDADRDMNERRPIRAGWGPGPVVEFARGGHGGLDPRLLRDEVTTTGGLTPVEVTAVTVGHRLDWAEAVTAARARVAGRPEPDTIRLLDVVAAWDSVEPLRPPRYRQPIRRNIPTPSAPFIGYDSRSVILENITGERGGTTILLGDQGTGKSRLAMEAAADAPWGRAWFLNASTNETLRASLAQAEHRERFGPSTTALDADQVSDLANLALERLSTTGSGWVVVLDNVRFAPSEAKWLPQPDPDRHQHLIITTTEDEAWSAFPGGHLERLEPLPDGELPDWVAAHPLLAELAAGRPLLIDAFARYRGHAGTDALAHGCTTVVERRQAAGEQVDGPSVFCELVLDTAEDELAEQVAGFAAWLPPDHIALDLLEPLAPGAGGAAHDLVGLGLFQPIAGSGGVDMGAVAVHRLFAAAIRDRRAAGITPDPALVQLLSDDSVARLLGTSAEADDFDRMNEQLSDLPQRRREYGVALHGLATAEELYTNVDRSSATFERALDHLDRDDPRDAAMVAACLHGMARLINRRHPDDARRVAEGIELAEEALALRESIGDPMGIGQSQAMVGILMKIQASHGHVEADRVEPTLREALEILDRSHELRRDARREDPDDLDVARAMFNRAGVRVNLAKVCDPDETVTLLDEAEAAYRRTEDVRRRVLLRAQSDLIATCVLGRAIVDYCRATLVRGAPPARRAAWLRQASRTAQEALADFEALASSHRDRSGTETADVNKANRLLAKVALARVALRDALVDTTGRGGLAALDKLSAEAHSEVAGAMFGPDGP